METAIFDADSHLMETPEWLGAFAEDGVRDRLGSLGLEGAGAGAAELMASLPELWETHRHQDIGPEVLQGPKGLDGAGRARHRGALPGARCAGDRGPARLPDLRARPISPGARIPTCSTAGPRP